MTTSTRQFKDAIYEQLARIGKSLGSGPRLEILDILCQGPRTVEALAKQVGQSVANTSHHLQVLRRARLVDAEKEGVHVTYRLADEEVCAFFRALRGLAESRLLEIEQVTRDFLQARGSLEPVDRDALVARVRSGAVNAAARSSTNPPATRRPPRTRIPAGRRSSSRRTARQQLPKPRAGQSRRCATSTTPTRSTSSISTTRSTARCSAMQRTR